MVKITKWVNAATLCAALGCVERLWEGAERGLGPEAYQQPEFTAHRVEAGWPGLTPVLALVLGGREELSGVSFLRAAPPKLGFS